jgi:MoxR-like ATPase
MRLQCYEGIDATRAIYKWNYPLQLRHARALADGRDVGDVESELFSERFLIERPLLRVPADARLRAAHRRDRPRRRRVRGVPARAVLRELGRAAA